MDQETAYREIVSLLLVSGPQDRNLRRIIATVCKKYHLSQVPRYSDILGYATTEERDILRPYSSGKTFKNPFRGLHQ